MAVKITITNAGSNISSTLDLYTNQTGSWTLFQSGIAKSSLLAGYTFTPPVGAWGFRVLDTGSCGVHLDLYCATTTTTAGATPTTTTTAGPSPTTTTTHGPSPTTTTTTAGPNPTTTTTHGPSPTTTTTTAAPSPTTTTTLIPYYGYLYSMDNYSEPYSACNGGLVNPNEFYSDSSSLAQGIYLYTNTSLTIPFNGNSMWWYAVDNVDCVVRVNSSGYVLSFYNCSSLPGTTTTTYGPTTTTTYGGGPTTTTTLACYTIEHVLYYDADDPAIACFGPSAPSDTYYSFDSSIFADVYNLHELSCYGNEPHDGYYVDRVTGVCKYYMSGVLYEQDPCSPTTTTTTYGPTTTTTTYGPTTTTTTYGPTTTTTLSVTCEPITLWYHATDIYQACAGDGENTWYSQSSLLSECTSLYTLSNCTNAAATGWYVDTITADYAYWNGSVFSSRGNCSNVSTTTTTTTYGPTTTTTESTGTFEFDIFEYGYTCISASVDHGTIPGFTYPVNRDTLPMVTGFSPTPTFTVRLDGPMGAAVQLRVDRGSGFQIEDCEITSSGDHTYTLTAASAILITDSILIIMSSSCPDMTTTTTTTTAAPALGDCYEIDLPSGSETSGGQPLYIIWTPYGGSYTEQIWSSFYDYQGYPSGYQFFLCSTLEPEYRYAGGYTFTAEWDSLISYGCTNDDNCIPGPTTTTTYGPTTTTTTASIGDCYSVFVITDGKTGIRILYQLPGDSEPTDVAIPGDTQLYFCSVILPGIWWDGQFNWNYDTGWVVPISSGCLTNNSCEPTPTTTTTTTYGPTTTTTSEPPTGYVVTVNNSSDDVQITQVHIDGVLVSYDSGSNFPVTQGNTGYFKTYKSGSCLIEVSYRATSVGQNIVVNGAEIQCYPANNNGDEHTTSDTFSISLDIGINASTGNCT